MRDSILSEFPKRETHFSPCFYKYSSVTRAKGSHTDRLWWLNGHNLILWGRGVEVGMPAAILTHQSNTCLVHDQLVRDTHKQTHSLKA